MGMVTTVCARTNEPLEAFRAATRGAVFPPKAAVDEPGLLLALAADSVHVVGSSDPRYWQPSRQSAGEEGSKRLGVSASLEALLPSFRKQGPTEHVQSFGVLRNAE